MFHHRRGPLRRRTSQALPSLAGTEIPCSRALFESSMRPARAGRAHGTVILSGSPAAPRSDWGMALQRKGIRPADSGETAQSCGRGGRVWLGQQVLDAVLAADCVKGHFHRWVIEPAGEHLAVVGQDLLRRSMPTQRIAQPPRCNWPPSEPRTLNALRCC